MASKNLILLRHGESQWNALNLFTGWVDVDLSEKGISEAIRGGSLLNEQNLLPDVVHTSLLTRAIKTANIALEECGRLWIDVKRTWRLNERHYGALQGKNKKQTLEEFGEEQFQLWRRSFDVSPPAIDPSNEFAQTNDPRYRNIPSEDLPQTECLKDVVGRLLGYWKTQIAEDLKNNKTVLVVAHGNSLRALVKELDSISDADIANLNIPTGIPLLYELDDSLKPRKTGGTYLDPEAAALAVSQVANQGK